MATSPTGSGSGFRERRSPRNSTTGGGGWPMRPRCSSSPPVRRELEQRGRIGQPPPPVVELRGERLSLKPLPLPVGEVAILDGQLRKRRWPASGEGVVECHELRKKHGECRDAI